LTRRIASNTSTATSARAWSPASETRVTAARAADVPRSSFVQRLRDHVIVTSLTGAKLRVLGAELRVDLEHELFERVFHPAIGSGARSRL
jgi:hypothetical protein